MFPNDSAPLGLSYVKFTVFRLSPAPTPSPSPSTPSQPGCRRMRTTAAPRRRRRESGSPALTGRWDKWRRGGERQRGKKSMWRANKAAGAYWSFEGFIRAPLSTDRKRSGVEYLAASKGEKAHFCWSLFVWSVLVVLYGHPPYVNINADYCGLDNPTAFI